MQTATNNANLIILTREEWAKQLSEAYKKGAEDAQEAVATACSSNRQKSKKAAKVKASDGKTLEWRGAVVARAEEKAE